jgi:hypothetical protein
MTVQESHLIEDMIAATQLNSSAPCIGRLSGTNKQGDILVEYEGYGPQAAKLIANINRGELARQEQRGRKVLLVFEKGDPQRPIIVGLMESPLEDLLSFQVAAEKAKEVKDILIDGRRITIEAEDEVLLKCGKGSILIRKDGKIIIKGTDLLSRSSGRHRVRGASVGIN